MGLKDDIVMAAQEIRRDLKRALQPCQEEKFFIPTISGMLAFSSSLALSTFLQLQINVSTGTRPIIVPWTFGVVSVGFASLASHFTAIHTYEHITFHDRYQKHRIDPYRKSNQNVVAASPYDDSVLPFNQLEMNFDFFSPHSLRM